MTDSVFLTEDDGPVRTLTIDNPGRRNAIPADQWPLLAAAFEAFEVSSARVLVVRGAGDDFCSGLDVGSGDRDGTLSDWYRLVAQVARAARALHVTTKPTIAAVDGVAVGAGMNLALGCDVILASDRARFSEIFVKRGLTVDFGGTWLLPRWVGLARAKELALTGRVVEAAEAAEIGLASRVVTAAELHETAHSVAAELASGAPLAQRYIKRSLHMSFEMSFEEALAFESQAQATLLTTEDAAEGFESFLQKRDPDFRGR